MHGREVIWWSAERALRFSWFKTHLHPIGGVSFLHMVDSDILLQATEMKLRSSDLSFFSASHQRSFFQLTEGKGTPIARQMMYKLRFFSPFQSTAESKTTKCCPLYFFPQNNLPAARKAFDSFFTHYPYCYGYWKKYADLEKRHSNMKQSDEVCI